jgi:hypothetical protein
VATTVALKYTHVCLRELSGSSVLKLNGATIGLYDSSRPCDATAFPPLNVRYLGSCKAWSRSKFNIQHVTLQSIEIHRKWLHNEMLGYDVGYSNITVRYSEELWPSDAVASSYWLAAGNTKTYRFTMLQGGRSPHYGPGVDSASKWIPGNFLGNKRRLARKADNLTAICEPIV